MPVALDVKTFLTVVAVEKEQRVDHAIQPLVHQPDAPRSCAQHLVWLAVADCVDELVDGNADVQ